MPGCQHQPVEIGIGQIEQGLKARLLVDLIGLKPHLDKRLRLVGWVNLIMTKTLLTAALNLHRVSCNNLTIANSAFVVHFTTWNHTNNIHTLVVMMQLSAAMWTKPRIRQVK